MPCLRSGAGAGRLRLSSEAISKMKQSLLTSRQFAAALGVSPSLVRRWAASGELVPETRPSNRSSLFSPRDLARFRKRDRKRGPKVNQGNKC